MSGFITPFQPSEITVALGSTVRTQQEISGYAAGVSFVNATAYWFLIKDRQGNIVSHLAPNTSGSDNFPEPIKDMVIIERDNVLPTQDNGNEPSILRLRFNNESAVQGVLNSATTAIANGVTVVSAIPAGSNNIGHVSVDSLPALPAGGNAIGHVSVDTLPALPAGGNTIGSVNSQQGTSSGLNLTAATAVKAAPGRIARVNVTVAGTAAGTVNDCATTGAAAAANQVFTIPNTVGTYLLDFPMNAGIVIVPGTGQTVSVSYA